jgi:5-methylcytosine-specific restriction endonuclease McrA
MRIIEKLESLRGREHAATVELIAALVECHTSKAHLDAGYESIWDLLVRRLEYSSAAASRRNAAAKIVARYPFVLDMLRSHRTSLTVLAKVARPLESAVDPIALLESIDGRSQREVERILACGRPVDKPAERVRRQVVRKSAPEPASLLVGAASASGGGASAGEVAAGVACAAEAAGEVTSAEEANRTGSAQHEASRTEVEPAAPTPPGSDSTSAPEAASDSGETETEERVSLSFSLSAEDYESFEQAKAILARKLPMGMSLEDAFNELVSFYLAKKKPRRRTKHSRESKAMDEAGSKSASETSSETPTDTPNDPSSPRPRSRHVPAATRAAVFERDGHRCSYVAGDGTRCAATRDLQIDHVRPFALGGSHGAENLRVLCARHNRRVGELIFGPVPRE